MLPNNLTLIDFSKLYKEQRLISSYKPKDANDWDKKAFEMNQKVHESSYNEIFESFVLSDGATSLLDVGSGPGTFALRFANKIENIHAIDFSSKMLEILKKNAQDKNLTNITTHCLDLESSWKNVPKCDIVIASRCLEVNDLKSVLHKLDSYAKKGVYISFKFGGSYLSDKVLEVIKRNIEPKPDYIYVINILYQLGIYANLNFIKPNDNFGFNDVNEYINSISWSIGELNEAEKEKLKEYFFSCKQKNITPALRNNNWAMIWWRK